MTDDPFLALVVEALNLLHPRFASAHGLAYTADEADTPAAVRKERERSVLLEFYHQFRRLWDKALPVKLGLGHVVVQGDPDAPPGRQPDLLFWQLDEDGRPDRRLAAVSVVFLSNPSALMADLSLLARYQTVPGYPIAVCVVVGRRIDVPEGGIPSAGTVTRVFFDTDRRAAEPL
ncbi:MAG: hypothetical protein JWO38_2268 [Gemmataceae bacterium]|nr:hypothetical protein [Gemmataceae bacterium]